jgi:hypothetical protein
LAGVGVAVDTGVVGGCAAAGGGGTAVGDGGTAVVELFEGKQLKTFFLFFSISVSSQLKVKIYRRNLPILCLIFNFLLP